MKELKSLIQQGQLTQAIEMVISQLKTSPKNKELRSYFVELLCIDGQYERADQQLQLIVKQHPECLPGVVNMRQLVKAAQARVDFSKGADTAHTVGSEQLDLSALITLRLAMSENDVDLFQSNAEKLEQLRESSDWDINGQSHKDIRDIDDSLAGYLEVFGANGRYYLVPMHQVIWLKLLPATSISELVWRKAEIDIHNGPSGEVFVPMTYLASHSDAEKLGRETDWQPILGTEFYQGKGLKMFLVDDSAQAMTQWQSFSALSKVKESA